MEERILEDEEEDKINMMMIFNVAIQCHNVMYTNFCNSM